MQGEPGKPFAPFILRNITKAFLIQLAGALLSLWMAWSAIQEAREVAVSHCIAGNERSRLQLEDFADSARMTASLDLERLLGVDAAGAAEIRAITAERTQRRIERLPFLDCKTGKRTPPPPIR